MPGRSVRARAADHAHSASSYWPWSAPARARPTARNARIYTDIANVAFMDILSVGHSLGVQNGHSVRLCGTCRSEWGNFVADDG